MQADFDPPSTPFLLLNTSEDDDIEDHEIGILEEEVNAALKAMNLPQPESSGGDSDHDSDFDDTV